MDVGSVKDGGLFNDRAARETEYERHCIPKRGCGHHESPDAPRHDLCRTRGAFLCNRIGK